MNSIKVAADNIIKNYVKIFTSEGYYVSGISEAAYNYEVTLSGKNEKIKIQVFFGKKGTKTLLQGNKESELYKKIFDLVFGAGLFVETNSDFKEPEEYIGTDESGKGDYFGPLVIAGVYADSKTIALLKKAGVRDSKELNDSAVNKISFEIKKIIGNKFSIVVISPEKYNKLYNDFKNLNKLLGWAHSRVLENILKIQSSAEAISDKFGDERFIINSLQEKGKEIKLHQFTKAEKFTAVAAASILARNKLNEWFSYKSSEINIEIPKGASEKVEGTARKLISLFGTEFVSKLVKLHFKTSGKINLC